MADARANIQVNLRGAKQAQTQMKSLGSEVQSTILKYGAMAFSAAAVWRGFKSVINASIDQEKIFRKLKTAVDLTGASYNNVEKSLKGYFAQLQATTEYGDTDSAEVLTTLVQLTGDYEKALKNLPLVLDIASSGLFDINTAARNVGMAISGAPEIWGRYIGALKASSEGMKDLKDPAEKAEYALKLLNEKFGGTAKENVKSTAGAWQQIANSLSDVSEAIGDVILESSKGVEGTSRILDFLNHAERFIKKGGLFDPVRVAGEGTFAKLFPKPEAVGFALKTFEQIENETKKLKVETEKVKTEYQKWAEEQIKSIKNKEKEVEWTKRLNAELIAQANVIHEAVIPAYENFGQKLAEFPDRTKEVQKGIKRVQSDFDDFAKDSTGTYRKWADDFSSTMGDVFLETRDQSQNLFSNIANMFTAMLEKMIADLLARAGIFFFLNLFTGGKAGLLLGGEGGSVGFTDFLFGGFKQSGGNVSSGKSYVVGEHGAEIFTPNQSGYITPNEQVGQTTIINLNIAGNVIEERQWTRRVLIPEIYDAARKGYI